MDSTRAHKPNSKAWFPLTYLDPVIAELKGTYYGGRMPSMGTLTADGGRQPSRNLDSLLRQPRKLGAFVRWLEFNVGPEYSAAFRVRVDEVVMAYGEAERYLRKHWHPPPGEGDDPETHFPDWYEYDHVTGFTKCAYDKWDGAVHKLREFHDYLRQMREMLVQRTNVKNKIEVDRTAEIVAAVSGSSEAAATRRDAAESKAETPSSINRWLDKGEFHEICFAGETKSVKANLGVRYYRSILKHTGTAERWGGMRIRGGATEADGNFDPDRAELHSDHAVQQAIEGCSLEQLEGMEQALLGKIDRPEKTSEEADEVMDTLTRQLDEVRAAIRRQTGQKGRTARDIGRLPRTKAAGAVDGRLRAAREQLEKCGFGDLASYLKRAVKRQSDEFWFQPESTDIAWKFD